MRYKSALRVYHTSVEKRGAIDGVPVGVRKRTLTVWVAVVALLLYFFGSGAPDRGPPSSYLEGEDHGLVDLASGEGAPPGEEAPASRSQGAGNTAMAGEDGEAYQEAVDSLARSYDDTIEHANPLVHKLLMHSEGTVRMTRTEIEELGDLLSAMGEAPDSDVIGSYPEGYVDCDGYLRAGATSLGLAADSIRGFNQTADMEYLRDYRRLISMYMRAVADAQWCVSDHLHQTYH